MDAVRREVTQLFDLVDAAARVPESFTRAIVECILYVDPGNARAQELLDRLDGYERIEDEAALRDIEKAEHFAAAGAMSGARAMTLWVRRRHGEHPVAQAWLEGAHLLFDG